MSNAPVHCDTSCIGIEIPGAYDGVLFWHCEKCGENLDRFPEGHYLHDRARNAMLRWGIAAPTEPAPPPKKAVDLAAVYAQLPTIECRGLCHSQCTVVPATDEELAAMQALGGDGRPHKKDKLRCRYLTRSNRCKVYEARPLMCRLYGVAEGLECPHGCKPSRLLTQEEAARLMDQTYGTDGPRPFVELLRNALRGDGDGQ